MLELILLGLSLGGSPAIDGKTVVRSAEICSAERPAYVSSEGAQLAYRDLGPRDGRPVLLISGTDQQMIQWPQPLLKAMQAQGLRPIVYDARDVGCSTHHTGAGPADWAAILTAMHAGKSPVLPYTLETLAADAVAILDHLDIAAADIVGVSGGATVASEVAAANPERVCRLVLLLSNSGNPALPMPAHPVRLAALPPMPAAGADSSGVVAYRMAAWRVLSGTESPNSPEHLKPIVERATTRSWDPDGIGRAGAALLSAGDRRNRLADVNARTVVIHGEADPLISVLAGREAAESIPGAKFIGVSGAGHILTPDIVDALLKSLGEAAAKIPHYD